MAPSGVLMVGAALVLRDLVQRRLGVEFGVGAIVVGAAISAGLAPPSLVVASASHSCCRNLPILPSIRRWPAADWSPRSVASSIVGLVVDSIVFLWLAFGSLEFLPRSDRRQNSGWFLLAIPFVAYLRRRDERLGPQGRVRG